MNKYIDTSDEEIKNELEEKIDAMLATMKPFREEDVKMEEEHVKIEEAKEIHEMKPRTYGMNLTNDHGYVWNVSFVFNSNGPNVVLTEFGHRPNIRCVQNVSILV